MEICILYRRRRLASQPRTIYAIKFQSTVYPPPKLLQDWLTYRQLTDSSWRTGQVSPAKNEKPVFLSRIHPPPGYKKFSRPAPPPQLDNRHPQSQYLHKDAQLACIAAFIHPTNLTRQLTLPLLSQLSLLFDNRTFADTVSTTDNRRLPPCTPHNRQPVILPETKPAMLCRSGDGRRVYGRIDGKVEGRIDGKVEGRIQSQLFVLSTKSYNYV